MKQTLSSSVVVMCVFLIVFVLAMSACFAATVEYDSARVTKDTTPTPSQTPTPTSTETATPTPTLTSSPTPAPTPTPSPMPSPSLSMKWDQQPNLVDGFDMPSFYDDSMSYEIVVADDWEGTDRDSVVRIVWWGSYFDYAEDLAGPVEPPLVPPEYFAVTMWEYTDLGGFGEPGAEIISEDCYEFNEVYYASIPQWDNPGFYEHEFMYQCDLAIPWEQVEGVYYFLSIKAVWMSAPPEYLWGWANSDAQWNDDAVTWDVGEPVWEELYWPIGHAMNLRTVLFSEDFEGGWENWTSSGLWHRESEVECGSGVAPYPSGDYTGYYGRLGNCNYDVGDWTLGYLRMDADVDLSLALDGVYLSFWSYEETEVEAGFDLRFIDISTDGGADWGIEPIWESAGPEGEWYEVNIDLSSYIGDQVRIRFGFDSVDGTNNDFFGWMIDDVVIYEETPVSMDMAFELWVLPIVENVTGFDFEDGQQGWLYFAVPGFGSPTSSASDGAISIYADSSADMYAVWESDHNGVDYFEESVYRVTWTMSTSQEDSLLVPGFRLMVQTESYVSTGYMVVYGSDMGLSPIGTTDVVMYYMPPDLSRVQSPSEQIYDDLYLEFDLLSFQTWIEATGYVSVENIVVDRMAPSALEGATVAMITDFVSGWRESSAGIVYSVPTLEIEGGKLTMATVEPVGVLGGGYYGGYETISGVVPLNDGKMYNVIFTVSSDAASDLERFDLPSYRMMVFSDNNANRAVVRNYTISNVYGTGESILDICPSSGGNAYNIYLQPITPLGGFTTEGLSLAVEIVDWDDVDHGKYTIEQIEVQELTPPLP